MGVISDKFYIDNKSGEIYYKIGYSFKMWPSYFYEDKEKPDFGTDGWFYRLNENEIRYLINYWKQNEDHIINLGQLWYLLDLEKNYKNYLNLLTIKSIIE